MWVGLRVCVCFYTVRRRRYVCGLLRRDYLEKVEGVDVCAWRFIRGE